MTSFHYKFLTLYVNLTVDFLHAAIGIGVNFRDGFCVWFNIGPFHLNIVKPRIYDEID